MTDAVQRFYGAHAGLYDLLASYTPGVRRWRMAAVDSLDLTHGDTVLVVGCGTGASLALLSDAVGQRGTVLGLDVTPELLDRARRRTATMPNVSVLRGDAIELPVRGEIDGILACFVVGLLADPGLAITRWRRLVGSSGRVSLLDGVPTGWAHPLDRLFERFVRRGAPPSARTETLDRLSRRVRTAHGLLRVTGANAGVETFGLGFVRLTHAAGDTRASLDLSEPRPSE